MGTYNHWLRNALADRIEANGGYHAIRNERFPIAWGVPLYAPLTTVGEAVAALIRHGHVVNEADLRLRCPDYEDAIGEFITNVPEWAAEDMRSSLDDATYRTWSPETAKRYGFDYKGKGAERPFSVQFELRGRGGKHLCVTQFEGLLAGRSIDLAEVIRCRGGDRFFSNVRSRQLMGMMDEWGKFFSRDAVAAEYDYKQAWVIASQLEIL